MRFETEKGLPEWFDNEAEIALEKVHVNAWGIGKGKLRTVTGAIRWSITENGNKVAFSIALSLCLDIGFIWPANVSFELVVCWTIGKLGFRFG